MKHSYVYPFQVWLTSVLIGPVLLLFKFKPTVVTVLSYIFSLGFIQYYFVAVLIGGFCSIPCFLFLWLCYALLIKKDTPVSLIRVALALISLLCCITVFIVMSLPDLKNFWSRGNIILIGAYALPLIVGVFIYKVANKSSLEVNSKPTLP